MDHAAVARSREQEREERRRLAEEAKAGRSLTAAPLLTRRRASASSSRHPTAASREAGFLGLPFHLPPSSPEPVVDEYSFSPKTPRVRKKEGKKKPLLGFFCLCLHHGHSQLALKPLHWGSPFSQYDSGCLWRRSRRGNRVVSISIFVDMNVHSLFFSFSLLSSSKRSPHKQLPKALEPLI